MSDFTGQYDACRNPYLPQFVERFHPELPRRACFEHSAIHDHRFDFVSRALVGTQINQVYAIQRKHDGEFVPYLHEGKRTANGGRPWAPDGHADLTPLPSFEVPAGKDYDSTAYVYHRTEPDGDGRVTTIMAKRGEYPAGVHSTRTYGVQPDTDFDRYQWSPSRLWEIVADVMLGQKVTP
ncbi:UNVERIFIED_ORG: hypothetical protein J2W87_005014 [Pseudomonas putida]|nr:hypothetical protein [Pseudomonas putida]